MCGTVVALRYKLFYTICHIFMRYAKYKIKSSDAIGEIAGLSSLLVHSTRRQEHRTKPKTIRENDYTAHTYTVAPHRRN